MCLTFPEISAFWRQALTVMFLRRLDIQPEPWERISRLYFEMKNMIRNITMNYTDAHIGADLSGRRLEMALTPFESWGAHLFGRYDMTRYTVFGGNLGGDLL